MTEKVMVDLPAELMARVRQVATRTNRRVEDVLVEWIDRAGSAPSMETLSDEQLLEICDQELKSKEQEELSRLLERNREGRLTNKELAELDELMGTYRRGLLKKAHAWKVAVARGLKPRIS